MTQRTNKQEVFGIAIDRAAEVPICVQITWALRARIVDGRLKPGQRLPALREVAEVVGVNVNTARAVYQRLEREGLIDSQQGSGTFVASTPRRPSAVGTIAADAAREAHATGVDPREVAAALYVTSETPTQPVDEAADRRRLLRTQIAGLERTLGELEAGHPGVAPTPTQRRRDTGPTLPSVAELEDVRTSLVRRLATVQAGIDALGRGAKSDESERLPSTTSKRAVRTRGKTRPAPAGA